MPPPRHRLQGVLVSTRQEVTDGRHSRWNAHKPCKSWFNRFSVGKQNRGVTRCRREHMAVAGYRKTSWM